MSDQPLPLSGLRVVDCTVDRGELASRLLGDLGAEVVKVEPPGGSPAAPARAGAAGRVARVRGAQRGQARRRARPRPTRPTSSASTSCSPTPTCSSPRRVDLAPGLDARDLATAPPAPRRRRAHAVRARRSVRRLGRHRRDALRQRRLRVQGRCARATRRCSRPGTSSTTRPRSPARSACCARCTSASRPARASSSRCRSTRRSRRSPTGRCPTRWRGSRPGSPPARSGTATAPSTRSSPARAATCASSSSASASGTRCASGWASPSTCRTRRSTASSPGARSPRHVLNPLFEAHFADLSMEEVSLEAQKRGIVCTPALTPADILTNEHFRSRGTFVDVEVAPGVTAPIPSGFFEVDGERAGPTHAAARRWGSTPTRCSPSLGERRAAPRGTVRGASLPLAGLRVMDFGHGAVGVEVGRRFAEYGAEVMKIESRTYTDFMRLQLGGETNPSFASSSRSQARVRRERQDARGRRAPARAGGASPTWWSRTTRPAPWTSSASGSTRSRR